MSKYSFLVYHKEYTSFLSGLQDLGVVHVVENEIGEIENQELKENYEKLKLVNHAINFLGKTNVGTSPKTDKTGLQVAEEVKALNTEQERLAQSLTSLAKDKNLLSPWGEFDWDIIDKLEDEDIIINFYTIQAGNFKEVWYEEFDIELINEEDGQIYFITINENGKKLGAEADEIGLPEEALSEVEAEIQKTQEAYDKIKTTYNELATSYMGVLEDAKKNLGNLLKFKTIQLTTPRKAEDKVMLLEGWVPKDIEENVIKYLETTGTYYQTNKPSAEDQVPVKLKNSRFARLYESIGELYTLPSYKELDLTPFFAPFYMLFFGFCLGDAGYGLLITLGCIYGLFKVKDKIKPLLKLGMYLGIATTIMGIVGGTFFGIMLHPENFSEGTTFGPFITKYQNYIASSDNLMVASLAIGYIQVLFGMFINAANRARMYGFKYSVSQLGWNIIVLITIPSLGLLKMGLIAPELGQTILIVSGIVGGVPALFYNSPGKNPLLNFGTGLWNTYGVVTGLLGDVLSYIRLFALGLSSAILGNVFNQLAMQSSNGVGGGIIGVLIMVLILAFGHGLNFFMAALGSFVHPLRLTFVEFYKNAGFVGGGQKYEPFSK